MLLHIPDILTPDQVAHVRARLDTAPWADGRVTAGYQSSKAKDNAQLPEDSAEARELGALVLDALEAGLLINVTAERVIRLLPPLILAIEEAQQIVERLVPLVERFVARH